MPRYEIAGTGKKTGRKRTRVYQARSEAEARDKAAIDETEVETVKELPPEPATERQLEYASALGIDIPDGVSKLDISVLISRKEYKDKDPTERHWDFAKLYDVEVSPYAGKKMLFGAIHEDLSEPGREKELIEWFAFRVYRSLMQGADDAPIDSPKDAIFTVIAEELASDEKVIESIRRYEGRNLIWFGQWTAPDGYQARGGSKQTTAYKVVAALLKDRVEIPKSAPKSKTQRTEQRKGTESVRRLTTLEKLSIIGLVLYLLWLLGS